jgi:ATP-dependent Clp protease ATP-binding subunit ClpC
MKDKDEKDTKNNIIVPGDEKKYPVVISGDALPPYLEEMAEQLSSRVIGQDRPIRKALRYVTIYEAQLNDPKRPAGILMLAGPSGVGKTHFAKEFAYAWIGPPKRGIQPWVFIDCGSLSLEHTVSSLTGSPPGYVGYGDQGNLEQVGQYERDGKQHERIKRWLDKAQPRIIQMGAMRPDLVARLEDRIYELIEEIELAEGAPRCVVIFDEIEKASKNIQRQLLSIMEEGKLAMLNGRVVDFRGSFLIFTTNVGTSQIISEYLDDKALGFARLVKHKKSKNEEVQDINEVIYHRVLEEIEDPKTGHFLPEFIGRIGKPGIVVFHVLQQEHYKKILNIMMNEQINDLLARDPEKAMHVSYTSRLEAFLIQEGVSPRYGARALRSVVERYIKTELALRILNGDIRPQDIVLFDVEFERPQEEDPKKKGAKIVVRRSDRPEGITVKPIEPRSNISRKRINLKKTLDDFFGNLWNEYQNPPSDFDPNLSGKNPKKKR